MCRGESNPLALKNRAVKEMREVTDVCRTKKKIYIKDSEY